MKLKNISQVLVVLCVTVLLTPQLSQAYYTTKQQADVVTPGTAFYAITYSFGLPHHDLYLPIVTERSAVNNLTTAAVGYTFNTSVEGDPKAGTSAGLVFSDAPIVDNMYKIAAGTRNTFTLFVSLTLDATDTKAKYGLQVTNLPYLKVDSEGNEEQLGLNEHELGRYTTKQVGLNK